MKTSLEQQQEHAEALRKSEARFRAIVSQATAGVAQTDATGRFVLVNPRYCEIVDYSETDLLGMKMQDITHPDDLPRNLDQFHRLVSGGPDFAIEKRYMRKDGSVVWVNNHVGGVRDASDGLQAAVAVVLDITDRKRTEQLLAEQQHLLELIATGRPLKACLDALTDSVSRLHPTARACVLMANPERTAMADSFAVHLSPAFGDAIRGAPINEMPIGTCGTAIHTGQPVTCLDIAHSDHWSRSWRDMCMAHGILACHSTPVFRPDGEAIASFLLCLSEARPPNEWELRLAEFGAHVASIVIERDRTAARLEAELADTKLLQQISAQLADEDSPEALYETILDAAVTTMRSEYGSLQMVYPERGSGGELRLLAFRGFDPEAAKFWEWVSADSASTCGLALRTGQRVIAPDVERCDFMTGTHDLATYLKTGIHAVQTTPLYARSGKTVGMISTHWRNPHQPSERDFRLLDILARQAADLIERRHAEEAIKALNVRLTSDLAAMTRMQQVSTALVQADDFASLLQQILNAAIEITGADMGNIQLLEGGALHIAAHYGFEAPFLEFFNSVHDGMAACGTALQRDGRIIIEDVMNSPVFAGTPALDVMRAANARAVQSTPLVSRSGRVLGMFSTHYRTPRRPSERELHLLDLLARQAADLIERKQAEQALHDSQAQLAALNSRLAADVNTLTRLQQVRMRLVNSDDLNARLAEILAAAANLTGTDKGNIQLYEAGERRLRIVVHQGFGERFLRQFKAQGSAAVCDVAALKIQRMIWEDIAAEPALQGTEDLEVILEDGIRAIQSTPLMSLDGRLLGLLNNHFPVPHRPSEQDLRYLDLLARMAADFIERSQSEQALRNRAEQFETLLNQAPLGVYLVDADFRIAQVNPVARPVFGDIPGGVIGRDFDEIIHILWEKDYADEIVRIFRHTLATGEPYVTPERAEFRIDRRITEYYEWRLDRITLPDGRYGLVCYFRDISAQVPGARDVAARRRAACARAQRGADGSL